MQLGSLLVFTIKPDNIQTSSPTLSQELQGLDAVYGVMAQRTLKPASEKFTYSITCGSYSEVQELLSFFNACKGSFGSILVPTFQNDFEQAYQTGAGIVFKGSVGYTLADKVVPVAFIDASERVISAASALCTATVDGFMLTGITLPAGCRMCLLRKCCFEDTLTYIPGKSVQTINVIFETEA